VPIVPRILAVDDEPDALRNELTLGLGDRAVGEVVHPRDVTLQHLEENDLVLVDYLLENWPERDTATLAMQPVSGLALAVLLREHLDKSPHQNRLTAFALHTAHLQEVRGRLPGSAREHLIARLNNLEWAFSKTSIGRWDQMVVLAGAVRQLPHAWGDSGAAEVKALKLLELVDDVAWFDHARRTVRACQPPIHDLSGGAHGLLFARWLLHQVMPYPSFLWRAEWLAARLRITLDSLRKVNLEGGALAQDLDRLKYRGVLADFVGERWWRAAVEDYVWNLTNGRSIDVDTLHAALHEKTGVTFEALPADAAIVCLGPELQPTGAVIAASNAVRVRPDQWPSFADDAWTSLELARSDAALRAIVDHLDEDRLAGGTS
jgi:hypothetical protein